jgi:hypothetical protein
MRKHEDGSVTLNPKEWAAAQKIAGVFEEVVEHLEVIVDILDKAEADVKENHPAKDLFNLET